MADTRSPPGGGPGVVVYHKQGGQDGGRHAPPPEGPEIREIYTDSLNGIGNPAMAEKLGAILSFTHIGTGHVVKFPAAILSFTDSHDAALSKKYGWGSAEPTVDMTQNSTRKISFTFAVASASIEEARYNAQSINLLICMMYSALDARNTPSINGSRINIKGMNFIQDIYGEGVDAFITTLVYKPDLENGLITSKRTSSSPEMYPTIIKFSIEAEVLIRAIASAAQNLPDSYPNYGGSGQ